MVSTARVWRGALLLGLLFVVAPALAGPPGGGRPPHGRKGPPPIHHVLERHADRLGLDDTTRRRISTIAEEAQLRDRELHRELRARHDAMRGLLDAEEPDRAAVLALAEEIGALENQAYKLRLGSMLDIRALLTPEQLEALVEIRGEERRPDRRRSLDACSEELAAFCPEVTGGPAAFDCLRRHRGLLSKDCRAASRPPHRRGPPPHRR